MGLLETATRKWEICMHRIDSESRDEIFRLCSPQRALSNHTPHVFIWNTTGLREPTMITLYKVILVFTIFRHSMLMTIFLCFNTDIPGYRGMLLNSVFPANPCQRMSEDRCLYWSIHTVGQVYSVAHLVVPVSTYSSCSQADLLLRRDLHTPHSLATLTSSREKNQSYEPGSHQRLLWEYRNTMKHMYPITKQCQLV